MQGDQQVGGRVARRRRHRRRRCRRERPARESAASAPRCASCRCWPRRAPARRCEREAAGPGHLHAARRGRGAAGRAHGTHRSMMARRRAATMAADARRLAGAALADALRDARATTLARTMDRDDDAWNVAQQAGINLPRVGARPPRLVRRVLDPARSASNRRRRFRRRGEAAFDRRTGRDLRLGPARARRPLARRPAVARRTGDAPRRPARRLHRRDPARRGRRRRELLPSPRALPRGHARRGVRLAARDARLAGAGGPGPAVAAATRAVAHRRRRGRPRPRARRARLRLRQRAAVDARRTSRRSRSMRRR